jgi:hypothetical protein
MTGGDWPIMVGQTLRRREVHALVGGQQQGGIVTPRGRPDILIFTDPQRGAEFGYDRYEGMRSDGTYSYTGAGQFGDQEMVRGNKAIQEAPRQGKIIRLFQVDGTLVTYRGAFTVGNPAYQEVPIPDAAGAYRKGIIFKLEPIDADPSFLPVIADERILTPVESEWRAPDSHAYEIGPVDFSARQAVRLEFDLQARFGYWLKQRGHDVKQLRLPAGSTVIQPDLYDATAGEVFEAKKSNARTFVRTAVGQVLDYAHVAQLNKYKASPSILLPGAPQDDLIGLCETHRIRLYVPGSNEREFVDLTA